MRVVALISGGKDSCYNMMQCVAAGHQIVALANLRPAENTEGTDELDSYMYQTVGHHAIDLYAEAMDLPLYRHTIKGTSVDTGRVYTKCEGDEVEDLYHLLKLVKDKEGVEGVSVGAILSDYQRVRVEDVCKRLNLQPLAYLWRRNQEALLKEMITSNIQAIIIKVAAFGLDPDKHLGKTLDQMEPYLLEVETSDKFMIRSCSCEVSCNEVSMPPVSEADGPQKTPPIIWKSLEHTSLQYSKPLECSGKSLSGYQWVSGVTARFLPLEGRSIQHAAQEAFSSLQANMNSKGLELKDIILVHLYMKNMKDFAVINSAYMTEFDLCPPARVCVEAPLLDGVLFWMDCLAHKCDVTIGDVHCYQKQIMHVQSISHWAPANIGPYSQSIKIGEVLYCAGQIALVPCTMQLVGGGIQTEATVSLSHVEKVLKAMSHNIELHHILMANCYVTDSKYIPVARAIWQKKLSKLKKAEDPEMYSDLAAVCGTLTVVVVPHLPRDALIEWHVTAVMDDPPKRKTFVMKMLSEGCQIVCEAVESSSASSASISICLSLISPSASSVDLDRTLHDMVAVFRQAVEKLSEDCSAIPLCFRTFYRKDSFDAGTLQAGLQDYLEDQLREKTPALILVPVVDLPEKEVIHVACWLS
ncbi:diphthine--ammonia ligase isoform X2 [Malaclemys terrapin pileata]|uniref:diphthine--ammonia ligase isoform X2 n=1 Tax=Malaclemys terrapin pileata TaxID=2991368 RepID=UPI0023A79BAE|nr:diphthine--ammonia ligase isoform X2 [Malaclemys terrapin pileata]